MYSKSDKDEVAGIFYEITVVDDPIIKGLMDHFHLVVVLFLCILVSIIGYHGLPNLEQIAGSNGTDVGSIAPFGGSRLASGAWTLWHLPCSSRWRVPGYLILILSIPLVKRLFRNTNLCYDRLWDQNTISLKEGDSSDIEPLRKEYRRFLKGFERRLNHRDAYLLALVFALIVGVINFSIPVGEYDWCTVERFPVTRGSYVLGDMLIAVFFGLLVWKILVTVYYLRRLSDEFDLNVQPLHPDSSGGMKPLGDLSFSVDSVLLAVGIWLSVGLFTAVPSQLWIVYSGIVVYMALATFLFFYPLHKVHHLMSEKKIDLLDRLSRKTNSYYTSIYNEVLDEDRDVDPEKLRKLNDLEELYRKASDMPVWPFDKETLTKFISTVGFPLSMAIVNLARLRLF